MKRLLAGIWTKEWTREQIDKYVGTYQRVYFTYAADATFRENASSGGSVSALLLYMLERGTVDGALVLQTDLVENHVVPRFTIARSKEEIYSAQGSKYTAVKFAAEAFPLIRSFEGKLAVVALPCDAAILHRYRQRHADFNNKIQFVITLVCGHNSLPTLTDAIIKRIGGDDNSLSAFRYRRGHWRGSLEANFEDGTTVQKPFSTFSDYQNLYFFAERKCHHCFDHMGYYSDLTAGDIWSLRMKNNPIKHTALIARSSKAETLVQEAFAEGVLMGQEEPIEEVLDGQARTLPFHYNISARARLGRIFGERIKDHTHERVRWNDYMAAFLVLFNERLTRSTVGRRIVLALPRPILKAYLYLLKGLESL
jgi:coenzyme F420 hydrogenase subunit beta